MYELRGLEILNKLKDTYNGMTERLSHTATLKGLPTNIYLPNTQYTKKHHCADDNKLKDAIDKAVEWWKGKVIFTRPFSADDTKAWRMINKQVETILKSI